MKENKLPTRRLLMLLTACLLGSFNAPAADAEASGGSSLRTFLEQDYLLGTWGGLRTNLHERGIDFEFLYAASVPINLEGGIQDGSAYQGAFLMMMDLDSKRLAGYEGGQFHVSSLWLHGEKPFSERYVGDLNKVNLLDFANGCRLWEMYYRQKFFDGKLSIKGGQLDIGSDFITPEYYNSLGGLSFLNQTFFFPTMAFNVWDQPYFPVGNHGLASTPYGAPGVLIKYEPGANFYLQAGAYDGLPDTSDSGTEINLNSDEGALIYFETGYRHNYGKGAEGLPGNFKLGGWYHTDDFYDMYQGTLVAFDNAAIAAGGQPIGLVTDPSTRQGNYGVYGLIDHYLWRENDGEAMEGLIGFARAAWAPSDRNIAQLGLDGGLVYKGLIPSRDWDAFGIAFSYLQISDDLQNAQDDLRTTLDSISPGMGSIIPYADYEAVLELSYRWQLAAWWTLNTGVQRVWHPGGRISAKTPDAWVLSLQTSFRF
jgi:porin